MVSSVHPIILVCIGLCTVMLICAMGKRFLVDFFGKMLVGLALILGINLIVPETFAIGINIITMVCAGILGIPGVIMLYLISFLTT